MGRASTQARARGAMDTEPLLSPCKPTQCWSCALPELEVLSAQRLWGLCPETLFPHPSGAIRKQPLYAVSCCHVVWCRSV